MDTKQNTRLVKTNFEAWILVSSDESVGTTQIKHPVTGETLTIDVWKFMLLDGAEEILSNPKSDQAAVAGARKTYQKLQDDRQQTVQFSEVDFDIFLVSNSGKWKVKDDLTVESLSKHRNVLYMENETTGQVVSLTWADFWCRLPSTIRNRIVDEEKNATIWNMRNVSVPPPGVSVYKQEYLKLEQRYLSVRQDASLSVQERLERIKPVCEALCECEYMFRRIKNGLYKQFKNPFDYYFETLYQASLNPPKSCLNSLRKK